MGHTTFLIESEKFILHQIDIVNKRLGAHSLIK